jgi:predicted NACHT family NTPase
VYRQQVEETCGPLSFSGFATADVSLATVSLEKVFVHLTLTVKKTIQELDSDEITHRALRGKHRQQEHVRKVQEPIALAEALTRHLLIIGEPGAGKSTLLRWLAVTFAKGTQREADRVGPRADADRLPVLVDLGRLPDQFLPTYLGTQLAFTHTPPHLLIQALADGRCLLLFYGLDEIADRQAHTRIARSLADLAHFSAGNRILVGSRPAGVSGSEGALGPQFQRCQIERFTPDDVQQFFRFWYALDTDLTPEQSHKAADTLFARVQATPATQQLATTPLLSTILLLIWRTEKTLPERRVDLYKRCCRVLIEQVGNPP